MSGNSARHQSVVMLFDNRSLNSILILTWLILVLHSSWTNFGYLNFSRKLKNILLES